MSTPHPQPAKNSKAAFLRRAGKSYSPSISSDWWGYGSAALDGAPVFTTLDIPRMLRDPRVRFALQMLSAPFSSLEFKVRADTDALARFIESTFRKFWKRWMPAIFWRYYVRGYTPALVEYRYDRGKVRLAACLPVEPTDAKVLEYGPSHPKSGSVAGYVLTGGTAAETILRPHAFWFAGNGEYSRHYDRPRLAGMFEPWLEKRGRNGAIASRRLWYHRHAFRGSRIRVPEEDVEITRADGTIETRNSADLGREMGEKMENGAVTTWSNREHPSIKGKYEWEIEDPQSFPDVAGLREYPQDLDGEIVEGAGIPREVITAAEVGSGWAGRRIPATAWLGSSDGLVDLAVEAFDEYIGQPLAMVNFGSKQYEIVTTSLVKTLLEEPAKKSEGGPGGASASVPAAPPRAQGGPGGEAGDSGAGTDDPFAGLFSGNGDADTGAGLSDTPAAKPMSPTAARLLALAMVRARLDAGDGPDANADELDGLADLAGDPDQVREIFGASLGWAPYQGPQGGKGWKNDETGRIKYGGSKPFDRRDRKYADGRKAHALAEQIADGTATAQHVQEFSDHVTKLTKDQLVAVAVRLQTSIGGSKAKRDAMVDALRKHVQDRVKETAEAEAKSGVDHGGVQSGRTADGKTVHFEPHPNQGDDETTVMIDPKKLDAHYSKDPAAVRADGTNAVPGKLEGVRDHLASGKPMHAIRAGLTADGSPDLVDGRHRLRTLTDAGLDQIGVTVPKHQADDFKKKYGEGSPANPGAAPPGPPAGKSENNPTTEPEESTDGEGTGGGPASSDRRGGGSDAGEPAKDRGPVADPSRGPSDSRGSASGPNGGQPVGQRPARNVPAPVAKVNQRLDRYTNHFRSKGQHQVADWMDRLRAHVNETGVESALESLGPDAGRGDGSGARYEGGWDKAAFEEHEGGHHIAAFCEAYLNRVGITMAHQLDEYDTSVPMVSSLSPSQGASIPTGPNDFVPHDPTLEHKLAEAKALPGLEKSEDINTIMGSKVTHLTPEVLAKLDERYGKGRWIVKAYGDDAAAGYGIFFPQRAAQIHRDAQSTIWQAGSEVAKYGFSIDRDKAGSVVGLKHQGGDRYPFGSKKYEDTIHGDVRHWGDRAAAAAESETGAALPGGGHEFMAQPAFEAVGVSDADRAAGKTIAPGEGRVHITTRNGKAEIVPHSTWIKGEHLPVVFESEETKAMAQAAVDAINALPESERNGQIYAPDIIKAKDGYKVVEANPANKTGSSGYLGNNPMIIDSYVSHLTDRDPAHVRFIRNLLSSRK